MFGMDLFGLMDRVFRRDLNRPDVDMLNLLANVIEGRDPYTAGHTWRVTKYVTAMAQRLAWSPARVASIEIATLFHDLGKISTEDRILKKPAN